MIIRWKAQPQNEIFFDDIHSFILMPNIFINRNSVSLGVQNCIMHPGWFVFIYTLVLIWFRCKPQCAIAASTQFKRWCFLLPMDSIGKMKIQHAKSIDLSLHFRGGNFFGVLTSIDFFRCHGIRGWIFLHWFWGCGAEFKEGWGCRGRVVIH